MDKIIIKNLKLKCNIGITKKERKKKQLILIDIIIYKNFKNISDNINETINYSIINKKIKKNLKNYSLIETLGNEIANIILNNFETNKIELTIKKPNGIKNADYAGVNLIRKN